MRRIRCCAVPCIFGFACELRQSHIAAPCALAGVERARQQRLSRQWHTTAARTQVARTYPAGAAPLRANHARRCDGIQSTNLKHTRRTAETRGNNKRMIGDPTSHPPTHTFAQASQHRARQAAASLARACTKPAFLHGAWRELSHGDGAALARTRRLALDGMAGVAAAPLGSVRRSTDVLSSQHWPQHQQSAHSSSA